VGTEVDNQLQRLNQARQRAEELSREKSQLTGELDSHKKRLSEEEAKCQQEFECGIAELPALIENFKTEAETSLSNAEYILGLREDAPVQAEPEPEPAPAPAPVAKGGFKKPVARVTKISADEDGLM
jgi:hypothetical protein